MVKNQTKSALIISSDQKNVQIVHEKQTIPILMNRGRYYIAVANFGKIKEVLEMHYKVTITDTGMRGDNECYELKKHDVKHLTLVCEIYNIKLLVCTVKKEPQYNLFMQLLDKWAKYWGHTINYTYGYIWYKTYNLETIGHQRTEFKGVLKEKPISKVINRGIKLFIDYEGYERFSFVRAYNDFARHESSVCVDLIQELKFLLARNSFLAGQFQTNLFFN